VKADISAELVGKLVEMLKAAPEGPSSSRGGRSPAERQEKHL